MIMGCTHYPIIKDIIEEEIDKNVKLVDPGVSVAKTLKEFLAKNKMLNAQKRNGKRDYFVTDYTERFIKVAEMFLGEKTGGKIQKVEL